MSRFIVDGNIPTNIGANPIEAGNNLASQLRTNHPQLTQPGCANRKLNYPVTCLPQQPNQIYPKVISPALSRPSWQLSLFLVLTKMDFASSHPYIPKPVNL